MTYQAATQIQRANSAAQELLQLLFCGLYRGSNAPHYSHMLQLENSAIGVGVYMIFYCRRPRQPLTFYECQNGG